MQKTLKPKSWFKKEKNKIVAPECFHYLWKEDLVYGSEWPVKQWIAHLLCYTWNDKSLIWEIVSTCVLCRGGEKVKTRIFLQMVDLMAILASIFFIIFTLIKLVFV